MKRHVRTVVVAFALAVSTAAACHRAANSVREGDADSGVEQSTPVTAAGDTLRGVLTAVGNEPLAALVITTRDGGRYVLEATTDGEARMLRNVVGLELMVRGARTGAQSAAAAPRPIPVFGMSGFVVRSADGHPTVDGVVSRTNDAYVLLVADGRRVPVPRLPVTLQQRIGARVFVAGPLDAPPISYGIIAASQPPI